MKNTLGSEFLGSLFKLKSMLGAEFGKDSIGGKKKVNMPEYILLREIADNAIGATNNTELADIRGFLAISKSAISQMLAALEKKGYISRTVNPENRRNLIVTLTPLGRECLNQIDSVYNCRFEQVAEGIGEENMKEMIRLINLMNNTVDKLNDMEDAK